MTFSALVGNAEAKSFLLNLAHLPKAPQVLLFSGPQGVGKRSFALAFLQELLGKQHAKKIQDGIHPDVVWLQPEGKTKIHPVASIKNMIEQAPLFPFEADKKVYVIEEADRCLPASANALLKILEEPPAHVFFILLTSSEGSILPTILSRCCRVPFYPITEELLIQALEQRQIDPELAKQYAKASQGSFSKALSYLSEQENPIRSYFLQIIAQFFLQDLSKGLVEALEQLDKLIEKNAEEEAIAQTMDLLLEDLFFWIRDLHLQSLQLEERYLFHPIVKMTEKKIPTLEKSFQIIEEARFAFQRNSRPKVVLERLFCRFCNH